MWPHTRTSVLSVAFILQLGVMVSHSQRKPASIWNNNKDNSQKKQNKCTWSLPGSCLCVNMCVLLATVCIFYGFSVEFISVLCFYVGFFFFFFFSYRAHTQPRELEHTVSRYHTFACFSICMWSLERGGKAERGGREGRTEKKGEKMKRRQSRRGEGECKSNDGTQREKKDEERNRASAPADHTRHLW